LSLLAPESLSERGFVVLLLLFAMRRSRFVVVFFSFDDDVREQRKGSILFNRIPSGKDEEEEI